MLDDGIYTSAVGLDLQAITAELASCAGFIAYDAADQAAARHLFTEAALLAGSTGDPLLIAHSLALLAMQCNSLATVTGRKGLAREALRYLDQASQVARHEPSPKVHTIIAMRRAAASALTGDETAARAGIVAARREMDRGEHPSDPHWAGFVTPTEVTAHEALSWMHLGQHAKAAGALRAVLSDDRLPARNRTFYQARLAGVLSAAGDVDEAVNEGVAVLPALEGPVRSARTVNLLKPVRQSARQDSEFAVRFDAITSAP